MSGRGDHFVEMITDDELDEAVELLLRRGIVVDPTVEPMARLLADVRAVASGRPSAPSAELGAVLAGKLVADHELSPGAVLATRIARQSPPASPARHPLPPRGRVGRVPARVARMSLAAKTGIGVALAGACAAGAAAGGVLPGPAADIVRHAIEALTPFELPDQAATFGLDTDGAAGAGTPDRGHGPRAGGDDAHPQGDPGPHVDASATGSQPSVTTEGDDDVAPDASPTGGPVPTNRDGGGTATSEAPPDGASGAGEASGGGPGQGGARPTPDGADRPAPQHESRGHPAPPAGTGPPPEPGDQRAAGLKTQHQPVPPAHAAGTPTRGTPPTHPNGQTPAGSPRPDADTAPGPGQPSPPSTGPAPALVTGRPPVVGPASDPAHLPRHGGGSPAPAPSGPDGEDEGRPRHAERRLAELKPGDDVHTSFLKGS
jgi:translation initiation factor IF-2